MRFFLFTIIVLFLLPATAQQSETWVEARKKTMHAPTYGGEVQVPFLLLHHTVKEGENLTQLADRFLPPGSNVGINYSSNDPDLLITGEIITIAVWPWEIAQWDIEWQLHWKRNALSEDLNQFTDMVNNPAYYWDRYKDALNYKIIINN